MERQQRKVFALTANIVVAKELPEVLRGGAEERRRIAEQEGLRLYGVASADDIASENPNGVCMAGYHPDYGCVYIELVESARFADRAERELGAATLDTDARSRMLGWAVLSPDTFNELFLAAAQRVAQTGRPIQVGERVRCIVALIESDVRTNEVGLLIHILYDLYMRLGWLVSPAVKRVARIARSPRDKKSKRKRRTDS